MRNELKTSLSQKKTLLIISLISLLLGVLSCVLGDIILPLLIASLAILYLFDSTPRRTYAVSVSLVLAVLNLTGFLFGITVSAFAPCAIILSLILCYAYIRDQSKADAAYVMTIISAAFTLLSCILLAMIEQGAYTWEAVTSYYGDLHDSIRTLFISGMIDVYTASGLEVTEEIVASVFDIQIRSLISYIVIGSFVIVGLSMKAFSLAVSKLSENKRHIIEWRFVATNIFAYSYLLLVVASIFVHSADSVFAISVLNLYNIFQVIFAYVGFNFAMAILTTRMRTGTAFIILFALLAVFSSFVIQLLAVMGVMFTLRSGRITSKPANP